MNVPLVPLDELSKNKKLVGAELRNFSLNQDDFQTVKIQLRALGLIIKSDKARSVKDVDTYWTLTPYGDEVMTRLRAIRRQYEQVEEPTIVEDGDEV
jgi:predicted MarR family transcription regulator